MRALGEVIPEFARPDQAGEQSARRNDAQNSQYRADGRPQVMTAVQVRRDADRRTGQQPEQSSAQGEAPGTYVGSEQHDFGREEDAASGGRVDGNRSHEREDATEED
jgi:hypothetical protein